MLEYRRISEHETKRANDLEAQRRVLEASFHAVELCWTQVRFLLPCFGLLWLMFLADCCCC